MITAAIISSPHQLHLHMGQIVQQACCTQDNALDPGTKARALAPVVQLEGRGRDLHQTKSHHDFMSDAPHVTSVHKSMVIRLQMQNVHLLRAELGCDASRAVQAVVTDVVIDVAQEAGKVPAHR